MILNEKNPVDRMIPLVQAVEGRGIRRGAMVTPPLPGSCLVALKKLLIRSFAKERYCLHLKIKVTFRRHASFIIHVLCLVDSLGIYILLKLEYLSSLFRPDPHLNSRSD